MSKASRSGRPPVSRNTTAGKNLALALKVLGKNWRRDVHSPHHVLNWQGWLACDLPRSSTTIDRDIREGVPEGRIGAYCRCLGILPEVLVSSRSNMYKAMASARAPEPQVAPSLALHYRDRFPERYLEHNDETYINELFDVVGGVYRMYYVLQGVETLHRCTIWIYAAESYRLLARGRFTMFGIENHAEAHIFRWHNNLHLHYLCQNGLELGYIMTVDPLRHNLVLQRSPFWLKGQGLTDRGLANNSPITLTFRMEKLPLEDTATQEHVWQQECEIVRQRPFLAPGDAEYEHLRAEVLAPDVL